MIEKTIKKNNVSTQRYYSIYTVLFAILAILVYSYYIINGKSFVYCDVNQGGDGLVQHFNAFVYYGKYLRGIVKNLLFEHQLEIPMWDLSIGYGQDIISTLSYYVIGDPFAFLSIFFPVAKAEYGYSFLILLRIYFAGIAFSVYCRYRKKDSLYTLVGAFIYAFSYYTLCIAVLHPYFMLPAVYLPLLLMGADKVLRKEGDCFFIAMVALAGISNFYFFFMLCIMLVIYVVFNYFNLFGKIRIREFGYWFVRFFIDAILGVGMAAVLLLPSIINILSSSRISVKNYIPVIYELKYYLNLMPSFVSGGGDYYVHMGYTALSFIAVLILFMHRKEKKEYKYLCAGFLLLVLFLIFPFFGHLFNGLSYVTNRWIWALAFCVSYITVTVLPLMGRINRKEWLILFCAAIIMGGFVIGVDVVRTKKNMWAVYGIIAVLVILYGMAYCGKQKFLADTCVAIVMVSVSINALYLYSPTEGNYLENFSNRGGAYRQLTQKAPEYLLKELNDTELYRFDTLGFDTGKIKRNSAMQLNMYGTAYYFSATNGTISKFISDLYINTPLENSYNNLNGRSWLDAITAVKYFIIPKEKQNLLSYGYNHKVIENKENAVYTSKNSLPFGFTSSVIMSQDEFEKMDVLEKQQALLQGIVLDGDNISDSDAALEFSDVSVTPQIVSADGVEWKDGKFIVNKKNGAVTVSFNGMSNSELYVVWERLNYKGINPYSLYDEDKLNGMSVYVRNNLKRKYQYWKEPSTANVTASAKERESKTTIYTDKNPYYCGHHNFICNLGYSKDIRNTLTLTFDKIGVYSYDDMKVVNQPMDHFDLYCSQLKENVLEDIELETNSISGQISLDESKALCIAIPYSSGWSAKIDGKDTQILCADDMFIGLMLSPGKHQIELRYMSPYLREGVVLSCISCVVFIFLLVRHRKKYKDRN